ncbi:hypothetical protein V6N12_058919 [Hibiscus sabdariffa]|uniref:Uncharacterized protein n=1 Tax=Hibiscus sabdariffa TaxID=183260 RepID=A0ABR2EVE6_9ROSI
MTPPPAMVPLIRDRVSSTSSPLMTSCRCRGVILFTFRSLLAFSANSRTSAVSTFISCLPIDCYLTKFNKRGEMKPAPKRSSEAFKTIKRSSLIPVQKEKQTEEMEDIETGFEDLRLNETMMAIED